MNNIPKRNDKIYLEIENFKDYELTQCIAYEMAVRNEELIDKVVNLMNEYKQYFTTDGFSKKKQSEFTFKANFIANKYFINREIFMNIKNKYENRNSIFETIMNSKTIQSKAESEKCVVELKSTVKDLMSIYEEICNDRFNLEFKEYEDIELDNNTMYSFKKVVDSVNFKNNFYKHKKKIDKTTTIIFSRPKLSISEDYNKAEVDIKVNLSLPLKEIEAYIKKIKSTYDKNHNVLKAPIELLGEDLQQADSLVCDSKNKCFDSRIVLSKQQKIADMFYIYDGLKNGMTQRKIQNEVYNYYADLGIETQTLDSKTLKRYKMIAIDYIDNMRYKELVTGVMNN